MSACVACQMNWLRACVALGVIAIFIVSSDAAAPPWWSARGVTNGSGQDDYALLNHGQLKQIATQAFYEMEARLPGGAGAEITDMVARWLAGPSLYDDYAVTNRGQLKQIARAFYNRLAAVGFTDPPAVAGRKYPWTPTIADDDDFAYANIGQAKQLFSFDLAKDTDGDGIPDWWEGSHGLNPNNASDAAADPDGDGLTNLSEFNSGRDPHVSDSDIAGKALAVTPGAVGVYLDPNTFTTRTVTIANVSTAAVTFGLDNSNSVAANRYGWLDSDSSPSVAYSWNDISTTGVQMSTISGVDEGTEAIADIGFAFPFYGGSYSSVLVSANGYLVFDPNALSQYNNFGIPSANNPSLLIAPFFDDLQTGSVYYKMEPGKLTVQFSNAVHYGGSSSYTFQMVLEQSGAVTFFYQTMAGVLDSATIGIQDGPNPIRGLQVAYDQPYVHPGLAVQITPWVAPKPAAGTLAPGQRLQVALTFAAGSAETNYSATIAIKDGSGAAVALPLSVALTVGTDFDSDGLSNQDELIHGTDPYQAGANPQRTDSDGDGVPDEFDAYPYDAMRWLPAMVDPNDHTSPMLTLTKPLGAQLGL